MYPKSQTLPPGRLRPNPWNTNHVSPENEAKLTASISQHGLFKPVIVREVGADLEIIGGQHRWEVSKNLGLTEIMVVNVGPITDEQAKKIGLIDNARYGVDDAISLAELMSEIGDAADLQTYLPYTSEDLTAIFSTVDIALDKLDLDADESETDESAPDEPKVAPAPKTHAVMRYQVPLGDSEKIADLVARTIKRQGFTHGSELQNAGDALVFLLLGSAAPAAPEFPDELDVAD